MSIMYIIFLINFVLYNKKIKRIAIEKENSGSNLNLRKYLFHLKKM